MHTNTPKNEQIALLVRAAHAYAVEVRSHVTGVGLGVTAVAWSALCSALCLMEVPSTVGVAEAIVALDDAADERGAGGAVVRRLLTEIDEVVEGVEQGWERPAPVTAAPAARRGRGRAKVAAPTATPAPVVTITQVQKATMQLRVAALRRLATLTDEQRVELAEKAGILSAIDAAREPAPPPEKRGPGRPRKAGLTTTWQPPEGRVAVSTTPALETNHGRLVARLRASLLEHAAGLPVAGGVA